MSVEIKILIFLVTSIFLAVFTRRSLVSIQKHGLFRLLGWMFFIALVLVNIDYWFDEPFCVSQLFSWLLLISSVTIVLYGAISLNKGKANGKRVDPTLIGIEKTTKLVKTGAYRFIRHPMYSAFLFGAWGVFFKHLSLSGAILATVTSIFAFITAKKEESENICYFGNEYSEYIKQTKMFIPFIF